MTREEAIKCLKSLLEVRRKYGAMQTMKDEAQCLDMAIKALEQELCEDWYDVPSDEMTLEQARQAVRDLRKMWAEHLWQEPKWIPVSERLPEDEQEILFSTKTGRVHSGKYHDDDSANQWYSHKDKCRAWNNVVTAWMPLPELYKAESEVKE